MSFTRIIRHDIAADHTARLGISNGLLGVLLLVLFCAAQILWTLPGTSDAARIMATAEGVYLAD